MGPTSTLAAVLLTDMVESTATRVRLGATFNRVLRDHDTLIQDALARYSSTRRTDTGDGFRATFTSATAALDAACAIHWAVQERNESVDPELRFAVRIVLSAGELFERAGKLHGTALIEAARLEKLAGPGEIRCTDVVRLLAAEQSPARFVDPHDVPFKGLDEPRRVYLVDWTQCPPTRTELPLPAALVARAGDSFVGRAHELARLMRSWDETMRSGNRLVLLWGEAGMGKSALAQAIAQLLHQQQAWVLYGRCDPDTVTPYQPFAQALSTFLRDTGGSRLLLGRGHPFLAPLLAEEHAAVAGGSGPVVDPETGRFELFEAVADWLSTMSADHGALFVIDDLHLADPPTIELVRHVVRAAHTGNVCVVATCRSSGDDVGDVADAAGGVWRDLVRLADQVDDVRVRGFGEREVHEALRERTRWPLPVGPATTAFARELRRYTEGNPLFVRAIIADLPDDVIDRLLVGAAEPVELASLGVPQDVQDLFARRRRRLSTAALAMLDTAGVAGPWFQDDVVESAAGVTPNDAAGAFAELVRAGLMRPARAGSHEFAHALFREAALRALPDAQRVHLHLSVARAIESRGGAVAAAAELSQHYAASPDVAHRRASADYAVIAGDRAMVALAAGLAARHYRRALQQFDSLPEPLRDADRCDLVSKLGAALKQAGDPAATDALLDAARLAHILGDAPRMARAALATLSEAWGETGAVDEAKVGALERAVDAVGDDDLGLRARLLAALAAELSFSSDRARVDALSHEAVRLARELHVAPPPDGDRRVLARVLEHRHTVLLHADGLSERRSLVAELDRLAPEGDISRRFTVGSYGFWTAMESGDVAECRRRVEAMREIAEDIGTPRWVALSSHWQSALSALLGQIDDAERFAAETADLWRSIGSRDALVFSVGLHYLPAWYRGRLGDIVADVEACAAGYPGRVGMHAGRAHVWSVIGDRERADAALDDVDLGGTVGHHDQLVAMALTAMAARNVGDLDRLGAVRKLLEPYHDRYLFNGTSCFGSAHHFLALAFGSADDFDAAEAHFQLASEAHVAMSAPALLALTKMEWATMLWRRRAPSDSVRGRVLLEESLTIAHGLGLSAVERDLHRILASDVRSGPSLSP